MKATRKTIVKLDYRRSSGLFRRDGEYIADIQPDAGGRIIRKLGTDQGRARKLFWDVETEPNQRLHMDLVRLAPSAGDE